MKNYSHKDPNSEVPRSHPWTDGETDPNHRYYDFKENRELISEVLEDFISFKSNPAIKTFYGLLHWLNGEKSRLESNDSAFRGPKPTSNKNSQKAMQCDGRLMILYRDLMLNTSLQHVETLEKGIRFFLDQIDQDFRWGVIGTTIMKANYRKLATNGSDLPGYELSLSFWSWGDTESEVMANLNRVFENMTKCLKRLNAEIIEAGM